MDHLERPTRIIWSDQSGAGLAEAHTERSSLGGVGWDKVGWATISVLVRARKLTDRAKFSHGVGWGAERSPFTQLLTRRGGLGWAGEITYLPTRTLAEQSSGVGWGGGGVGWGVLKTHLPTRRQSEAHSQNMHALNAPRLPCKVPPPFVPQST